MHEILDLSKVLDERLEIYSEGAYSDPPLKVESWCSIPDQGYKVSRLTLGTQTGTHIDAPAHFIPGGATLEQLPLQSLVGPYVWVDLDVLTPANLAELIAGYRGETILFLTSAGPVVLSEHVLKALLELPCQVWVVVYGIEIAGKEMFAFNRALFQAGKYLIEDLNAMVARWVKPGGEMIALPLRLTGVSGSPCRVIVRQ
jgi:kynurenine formamidase